MSDRKYRRPLFGAATGGGWEHRRPNDLRRRMGMYQHLDAVPEEDRLSFFALEFVGSDT
jgi:hypothetical protein